MIYKFVTWFSIHSSFCRFVFLPIRLFENLKIAWENYTKLLTVFVVVERQFPPSWLNPNIWLLPGVMVPVFIEIADFSGRKTMGRACHFFRHLFTLSGQSKGQPSTFSPSSSGTATSPTPTASHGTRYQYPDP